MFIYPARLHVSPWLIDCSPTASIYIIYGAVCHKAQAWGKYDWMMWLIASSTPACLRSGLSLANVSHIKFSLCDGIVAITQSEFSISTKPPRWRRSVRHHENKAGFNLKLVKCETGNALKTFMTLQFRWVQTSECGAVWSRGFESFVGSKLLKEKNVQEENWLMKKDRRSNLSTDVSSSTQSHDPYRAVSWWVTSVPGWVCVCVWNLLVTDQCKLVCQGQLQPQSSQVQTGSVCCSVQTGGLLFIRGLVWSTAAVVWMWGNSSAENRKNWC